MPIKKPSSPHNKDSVNTLANQGIDTVNDKAADAFINRINDKPAPRPKRKPKTQIMMRIDGDLLAQIDERAAQEGISRSAWISQSCALRLKG